MLSVCLYELLDSVVPPSSSSVSLHGLYKQGHEVLLTQVKGSLRGSRGLQLAVSGDVRHSMAHLTFLPPVLGLEAALGQSDLLVEGRSFFYKLQYGWNDHLITKFSEMDLFFF